MAVEVDLGVVVELVEDQISSDGGGELVAVEDVAVGLVELLHGLDGLGGDGFGEVVPEGRVVAEGDGGDGDDGWGGGDGGEADFAGSGGTGGEFGERFAVVEEFGCGVAGLVEGRAVVVAGDVGEEGGDVFEVGPGHEAEGGSAVEHIEVDSGAVGEGVIDVFKLGWGGAGLVGVAPGVEPAGPVLGDEEGFAGLEGLEGVEAFFVAAGAEVDSGVDAGKSSGGEIVEAVDGVEEGAGEACFEEDVAHVGHIKVGWIGGGVPAAVLVFHLGHKDGAAAADLEVLNFLAKAEEPALGRDHEGGVVGAEGGDHGGILEEPCGEAAELPLGAGVGAGAEEDVEAFFLGGADEGCEVVVAVEVVVARGGLVDVPEDVGGDGVEAHGACHFQACVPVLAGDAGVVELAGEDLERLAVEEELVAPDDEGVLRGGAGLGCGGERSKKSQGSEGERRETGAWGHRDVEKGDGVTVVHLRECFNRRTLIIK